MGKKTRVKEFTEAMVELITTEWEVNQVGAVKETENKKVTVVLADEVIFFGGSSFKITVEQISGSQLPLHS
jgi:hypothetical protein